MHLTKKENEELVPVGGPTRIPTVQSHFVGHPKWKDQEREGEKGNNMRWLLRCLYTMVKMLRSVHCGDDAVLHYVCLYNLVMVLHCMFQLTDTSVKGSEWDTNL